MFNIVLVQPEIPQNTGNISRTCAVTGCRLHLVRPLGFSVDDRYLKRAGLDYWNELEIYYYDSFEELEAAHPDARFHLLSGDFLVFGKETAGLGQELLSRRSSDAIRIPMRKGLRSLNLSNSVAIVVYEGLRQNGYVGLV